MTASPQGLGADALRAVFPFHLTVDRELAVVLAVDDLHAGHAVLHEVDQDVDGTAAHHVHGPRRCTASAARGAWSRIA